MGSLLIIATVFTTTHGAGRDYLVGPQAVTHEEAVAYCDSVGGDGLATVIDAEDSAALSAAGANTGGDGGFIGLSDEGTEGVWRWDDGTQCEASGAQATATDKCIQFWIATEPNGGINEDCGELYFSSPVAIDVRANDVPCDHATHVRPPLCNVKYFETTGQTLSASSSAEQHCLDTFGTNAASIDTRYKFEAAYNLCERVYNIGDDTHTGSCALGGTDLSETENWVWSDGSDNSLLLDIGSKWDGGVGLWAAGQPANDAAGGGDYTCIATKYNKGIHDCNTVHDVYAICNPTSGIEEGIGCASNVQEIEVISDKIYACPGTIASGGTYGADAAALCGEGYSVCESAAEAALRGLTVDICTDPSIFTGEGQFFGTKVTSDGGWDCEGVGYEDIWGCGNPSIDAVLETLNTGSANFNCDVNGQTIFRQAIGNRDFGAWHVSGDTINEASTATLSSSASGGVLCCANEYCVPEANSLDWDTLTSSGGGIPIFDHAITIDRDQLAIDISVELPYQGYATAEGESVEDYPYGVTYVLDFEDFNAHSDNIYEPGTCQNRVGADFYSDGAAQTTLRDFAEWWTYSTAPYVTDGVGNINTMAYPPSGNNWVISMLNTDDTTKCTTVVYEGSFTWNELVACTANGGGESYVTTKDETDVITLSGVFYINVVSPYDAFGTNNAQSYYRVYQLLSAPFVIKISKSVYVFDGTGINVLSMSVIAVYKENVRTQNDFRLVMLTESQNYLKLTADSSGYTFSATGSATITTAGFSAPNGEDADETAGDCLDNKNFICSQLWEIKADNVDCPSGGVDFSGDYSLRFTTSCRDGDYNQYCQDWLGAHTNMASVDLEASLTWQDTVCDPELFTVQFTADMSFYTDAGFTEDADTAVPPHLFQVGEDEIYVEIDTKFAADTAEGAIKDLDIFETELKNVWLCTFDPNTVIDPIDANTASGGCFDADRDGGETIDNPYFYHIYDGTVVSPGVEGFEEITAGTAVDTMRFKFTVPHRIARDTLYVHAQVEVTLQSPNGRRRILKAIKKKERPKSAMAEHANQMDHFIRNVGLTHLVNNEPKHNAPNYEQPQQPNHNVYNPPRNGPQMPMTPNANVWSVSLSSPWVIGIGSLLAIVLGFNIIFMCYVNCGRGGRGRASFSRRRRSGYSSVKNADSEDFEQSEANPINVVSDVSD